MKKTTRIIYSIVGLVIIIGLLIQLIPYGHDHSNPLNRIEPVWDSLVTRELAVRACFDCHSNEVVWPWYSNIAPVSWLVQRDVEGARRTFNFSEWQNNRGREPGEMVEAIQEGSMPPAIYLLMHPSARLTPTQKSQLISGLHATR
jgi:hypothetical protein